MVADVYSTFRSSGMRVVYDVVAKCEELYKQRTGLSWTRSYHGIQKKASALMLRRPSAPSSTAGEPVDEATMAGNGSQRSTPTIPPSSSPLPQSQVVRSRVHQGLTARGGGGSSLRGASTGSSDGTRGLREQLGALQSLVDGLQAAHSQGDQDVRAVLAERSSRDAQLLAHLEQLERIFASTVEAWGSVVRSLGDQSQRSVPQSQRGAANPAGDQDDELKAARLHAGGGGGAVLARAEETLASANALLGFARSPVRSPTKAVQDRCGGGGSAGGVSAPHNGPHGAGRRRSSSASTATVPGGEDPADDDEGAASNLLLLMSAAAASPVRESAPGVPAASVHGSDTTNSVSGYSGQLSRDSFSSDGVESAASSVPPHAGAVDEAGLGDRDRAHARHAVTAHPSAHLTAQGEEVPGVGLAPVTGAELPMSARLQRVSDELARGLAMLKETWHFHAVTTTLLPRSAAAGAAARPGGPALGGREGEWAPGTSHRHGSAFSAPASAATGVGARNARTGFPADVAAAHGPVAPGSARKRGNGSAGVEEKVSVEEPAGHHRHGAPPMGTFVDAGAAGEFHPIHAAAGSGGGSAVLSASRRPLERGWTRHEFDTVVAAPTAGADQHANAKLAAVAAAATPKKRVSKSVSSASNSAGRAGKSSARASRTTGAGSKQSPKEAIPGNAAMAANMPRGGCAVTARGGLGGRTGTGDSGSNSSSNSSNGGSGGGVGSGYKKDRERDLERKDRARKKRHRDYMRAWRAEQTRKQKGGANNGGPASARA